MDLPTSAESATTNYLEELAELAPKLARSTHAATALALARELDADNSATSKSMCAKALNETMDRLRELAPPEKTKDVVDEVGEARTKRRKGKAAAKA